MLSFSWLTCVGGCRHPNTCLINNISCLFHTLTYCRLEQGRGLRGPVRTLFILYTGARERVAGPSANKILTYCTVDWSKGEGCRAQCEQNSSNKMLIFSTVPVQYSTAQYVNSGMKKNVNAGLYSVHAVNAVLFGEYTVQVVNYGL